MNYWRKFINCFIPHKGNNHKPSLLEEEGIAALLVIILIVTAFSLSGKIAVDRKVLPASVQSLVLVDLANENRADNNLPALTISPLLERAAQLKADDMAKESYFAHTSPKGITPWYWFSQVGYSFLYAGENLAVNYNDSVAVDEAWMDSPSHRANILNGNFTQIGIATSEGMYKGKKTTFVVQMFGSPKTVPVKAATTTLPEPSNGMPEPVASTAAQSDVLGETAEQPEEMDVIYANDTYISVKNTEPVAEAPSGEQETVQQENAVTAPVPAEHSSFFAKLLSSSGYYGRMALLILLGIVSLTLVLMIVIEVRKQHYKNILYGALVVALIVLLLVLGGTVLFESPIVL